MGADATERHGRKALIVTTVSGFVPQFEMGNVRILQSMGYEVHYASNFRNPSYGKDNSRLKGTGIVRHQVDFARSPFQLRENARAYRQLRKLLKEQHFELLHCHTPVGAALARLAAMPYRRQEKEKPKARTAEEGNRGRSRLIVIYTAHGFHFYKGAPLINWLVYYPVERWLAGFTDVLVTINGEDYRRAKKFHLRKQEEKQTSKKQKGRPLDKDGRRVFKINGVGIDIEKYRDVPDSRDAKRKELGVGEDEFLLVSVGELNRNKNHRMVLKALVAENGLHVQYLVCGEGKQRKKLESYIKKKHLSGKVRLLGYRTDVAEILKAADAFVLPSFREGLSLSLQEAMASGRMAVATDIRGNRELIDDGKGGYLVSPKDCKHMGDILRGLDRARAQEMGRYNQKRIGMYSGAVVGRQMRQVYARCQAVGTETRQR